MIQKKVRVMSVFATCNLCLVQQYMHSMFAARYLTTVGVKIDGKDVKSGADETALASNGDNVIGRSAMAAQGVELIFQSLADETVKAGGQAT